MGEQLTGAKAPRAAARERGEQHADCECIGDDQESQ
jgi:hypothetical protein